MDNLWTDTSSDDPRPAHEQGVDVAFDTSPADLIVIGAGFTGCAAALRAAERGAKVLVLEAQTVGHGGSGRNVGLVNAGLWLPPDEVEDKLGVAEGERLNAALLSAPDLVFELIDTHAIACEAVRNGTLHCAHRPSAMAQLRERARQREARGAPVRLLEADDARARTGSAAVHGALHDPRAGTIHPLAYCRGLARAARAAGAVIVEGTRAERIEWDGAHWRVTVGTRVLSARALLIATNAYHDGLANADRIVRMSYFQCATAPLSDNVRASVLPGREGCWDTATIMSSFRMDGDGRLVVGAVGAASGIGRKAHVGFARRFARRHFPQVGDIRFTHVWDGWIALTADHLPCIERLGPGGYAAYGYNGRGIGPGTVFGRALADACLTGEEAALPLTPRDGPAKERFRRLRATTIEAGAAAAHLFTGR